MADSPHPFVSRAVQATRGSGSLRVTVPQVVASTLGLLPGGELEWIIDPATGVVRVEVRRPSPAVPSPFAAPPHIPTDNVTP